MSDDLIERLEAEKALEETSSRGCVQTMPIYPCAENCPCALRDKVISQATRIRELEAELAAIEPAPVTPAEAWQPIETAPKDGTRILAWANRHGWKGVPQMVCVAYYKEACRWYIYGAGPTKHSPQWLDECSPTHWMPLPLPPRALADAGEAG